MTIKCNKYATLSLRHLQCVLTAHLIWVHMRWRGVPPAMCRVSAKKIKIEWLQCWEFVHLALHALRKALLLLWSLLYLLWFQSETWVVAGTRGRLNTQENGAEGISVLHAVFVCKIWKAWRVTIDWFGTLTTSVGCSVIQCTYRAAQTLAEQQNNLRRADSRIGNSCPNRKLYGDQLYGRNSTDTSKKGTVRYICVILYT